MTPDAGAVGQGLGIDGLLAHATVQPRSGSATMAEIGTISMPRFLASPTQDDTASTVSPKAEPVPTAKPLARAVRSSSSSFLRIAPRSRTPSMVVSPAAKGTPFFSARSGAVLRAEEPSSK